MAEETKGDDMPAETAPVEEATPAVEEGAEATGEDGKRNGKQQRYKRDETPIEELFDLSKPIPRVREHRTIFQYGTCSRFLRSSPHVCPWFVGRKWREGHHHHHTETK